MDVPEDLRYSTDHEWARQEDGRLRVGITDYARDALGDIVFVSLPEVGASLDAGATAGEVESTKAVSEIYTPVAGTIAEVNSALGDDPEVLNDSPYGDGWLFVVEPSDASAYEQLLDAAAYRALTED
jgi:glycine cleavage system H protein